MSEQKITAAQFEALSTTAERLTGRAWDGTVEHLLEITERQRDESARCREATEILNAHIAWLSSTKAAVEGRGERWNTVACRAQSRRAGDLTAPPEWIGEMCERLTPDWMLNR